MKILITIMMFCLLSACSSESLTTNTKSSIFKTKQEKLEFIRKYIGSARNFEKLDFHVVYHDNSTGMIPGPNDWMICLVAVVPRAELAQWTRGKQKIKRRKGESCANGISTSLDFSKITEWYQSGPNSFTGVNPVNGLIVYETTGK